MKELHEQVAEIRTREDLIGFIAALRTNLKEHPEAWENPTLDSFLGALGSWIEDSDGYYQNHNREIPKTPTWMSVGEMLAAARIYE